MTSKALIHEFMKPSGFELIDEGEDYLTFTTRQNGSVGDGSPGAADMLAAMKLRKDAKGLFPDVPVSIHTVDEWTSIGFWIPEAK